MPGFRRSYLKYFGFEVFRQNGMPGRERGLSARAERGKAPGRGPPIRQRGGSSPGRGSAQAERGKAPDRGPPIRQRGGSSPEKARRSGRGERHSRRAERRKRDFLRIPEGHALPEGKAAGLPVLAGRGAWGQTLTITKPCEWPQMGQTFQGSLPEASWPQWAHLNTVSFSLRYRVPELSRS